MEKENLPSRIRLLLSLPKQIFKISLALGTIALLLFIALKSTSLLIIGFYYVELAAAFNLFALGALIIFSFIEKKHQKTILMKTSIILVNIPIALFYYWVIIEFIV